MMRDDQSPTMDELEHMLATLPRRVEFPPTPDIAARIAADLPERHAPLLRRRTTWYAIAAVVLALAVLTTALPGPRRAIADFLGLPGIRIEFGPSSGSDESPTEIGTTILFGERLSLAEAQDAASFSVLLPQRQGEPDEVYLRRDDDGTVVSMLYRAGDGLPQIGTTGVGMLLMEFRSTTQTPDIAKRAMGDGTFVVTSVDGRDAFWITNGQLIVAPPDLGEAQPAFSRRSGNVLIWSDGQVTYRLETMLDLDAALRIAGSLEPWRGDRVGNVFAMGVVVEVSGVGILRSRRALASRKVPHATSPPDARRRHARGGDACQAGGRWRLRGGRVDEAYPGSRRR
jgi:hypothetical protein